MCHHRKSENKSYCFVILYFHSLFDCLTWHCFSVSLGMDAAALDDTSTGDHAALFISSLCKRAGTRIQSDLVASTDGIVERDQRGRNRLVYDQMVSFSKFACLLLFSHSIEFFFTIYIMQKKLRLKQLFPIKS